MHRKLGRHMRHNVVAYIALFFAMGGTAYAAATIGSAQIVDNSVRSVDVRNEASAGGGLSGADIRESTLSKVPNADKVDGLDSGAFARSKTYTTAARSLLSAKDYDTGEACEVNKKCYVQVNCDAGDRVATGGYYGTTSGTTVTESYPEAAPPTWNVVYENDGTLEQDLHARVICVDQAAPFRP